MHSPSFIPQLEGMAVLLCCLQEEAPTFSSSLPVPLKSDKSIYSQKTFMPQILRVLLAQNITCSRNINFNIPELPY